MNWTNKQTRMSKKPAKLSRSEALESLKQSFQFTTHSIVPTGNVRTEEYFKPDNGVKSMHSSGRVDVNSNGSYPGTNEGNSINGSGRNEGIADSIASYTDKRSHVAVKSFKGSVQDTVKSCDWESFFNDSQHPPWSEFHRDTPRDSASPVSPISPVGKGVVEEEPLVEQDRVHHDKEVNQIQGERVNQDKDHDYQVDDPDTWDDFFFSAPLNQVNPLQGHGHENRQERGPDENEMLLKPPHYPMQELPSPHEMSATPPSQMPMFSFVPNSDEAWIRPTPLRLAHRPMATNLTEFNHDSLDEMLHRLNDTPDPFNSPTFTERDIPLVRLSQTPQNDQDIDREIKRACHDFTTRITSILRRQPNQIRKEQWARSPVVHKSLYDIFKK